MQTFCSCCVTTILVRTMWRTMNNNILLFCIYTISFEIDVFKQYFPMNWKDFCSIDIVYMSLEIDIHRYTDKDASLLSLKKKI